jgi:CheY-like chemotaxis protein
MTAGVQQITVLVADRDDNSRSALKLFLVNEDNNLNISEAGSLEALQQLTSIANFNLMIIDWNFNRHDVSTLIKHYRKIQPNIIILVLSNRVEDKFPALEAGANAFVCKGDPPEFLYHTLGVHLDLAAQKQERMKAAIHSCAKPIYYHYLI